MIPEGASPLRAEVTPRTVSKSQGGLPRGMHWTVTKWSSRPKGVTQRNYKLRYWRTEIG